VTEITCIVCPMGCRIGVESKNGELELNGAGCRRGEQYVHDEVTCPKRVLTSVVTVEGSRQLLPVKTAAPIPKELIFTAMEEIKKIQAQGKIKIGIPKELIFTAMEEIKKIQAQGKIKIGQVIKENLAGTGVPLVAAKTLNCEQ